MEQNHEARKTVFVTGHRGYIGAVLVPMLLNNGYAVKGVDTGFFEEPNQALPLAHIFETQRDIRELAIQNLEGCDAVVHLAALCNDPLSDLKPEWTHEINFLASVRLAEMAREAGVQRFIYSSSCSIYGTSTDEMATESSPVSPLTAYAVSKVRAEEGISRLANSHFSPVYLRNATAYGWSPRLRADIVLNNLVAWAHTTGTVKILSDGTPWRPIVHVQDISLAVMAALGAKQETIHDQAFNVGVTSQNYRVRELAEIAGQCVPGATVTYGQQASPDARNYRVDFSKIARALPEFRPRWNARTGAQELYEEYKRTGMTASDFQGRKYIRLNQLKHLIGTGEVDSDLRWSSSDSCSDAKCSFMSAVPPASQAGDRILQ